MSKQTSNKFSPEVRLRAVRLVVEGGGDPPIRELEDQAMHYNLALPAGELSFVVYSDRFEEYRARAYESQRLADRYPAMRQEYEDLTREWRELAKQGEHYRA